MTCRHRSAVKKHGLRDCESALSYRRTAANYSADAAPICAEGTRAMPVVLLRRWFGGLIGVEDAAGLGGGRTARDNDLSLAEGKNIANE